MELECFKAYDIRGRIGDTLDDNIAWHTGKAFAEVLGAKSVVIGFDARESSPGMAAALASGLSAGGANVSTLGLCGTEEVYFATANGQFDGGIMVTASHNPIDYNGMKLVGAGSRPIDPDGAFREIKNQTEASYEKNAITNGGEATALDCRKDYARHVASFADLSAMGATKVLFNAGNGAAGVTADAVLAELRATGAALEPIRQFWTADATFPNGIPNPLLPENRSATADAVRDSGAALGVAWDGDFDRCFFFDADGAFVDGEYVVALVAQAFLASDPGAAIVHDPRVIWATQDTVDAAGGRSLVSKTGHAFLKGAMREGGAVYGGEMSAHHYFRDFFYCDSGMIPWIKVLEFMTTSGATLSELVANLRAKYPSSGEINFRVKDVAASISKVLDAFEPEAQEISRLDGVSLDFGDWRMNLRASNTEPLLRLNVETRGDRALLETQVAEIRKLIET